MNMTRYDPFREVQEQFINTLEQTYGRGRVAQEAPQAGGGWSPLVDVYEDSQGITLKVEMPEVPANDVEIQIEGNALTLRGERKLEHEDNQDGYRRIERFYGSFARSFTLPTSVDFGDVSAECRDGVLRIFLPKKAEAKPRQIKVQADSGRKLSGPAEPKH
jgi:HSP20 family protein